MTRSRRLSAQALALISTLSLSTASLQAQEKNPRHQERHWLPWWVSGEVHLSLLGDQLDQSTLLITLGYAVRAGYRFEHFGVFLQAEHNAWLETELKAHITAGAFNVGAGVDCLYFKNRVRAAISLGPSILLQDLAFDDKGSVGLFVDVRPTGIRWPIGRVTAQFDPLSLAVVAPVLSIPSIVRIEYRTVFAIAYD